MAVFITVVSLRWFIVEIVMAGDLGMGKRLAKGIM
jgi:hypothetical protein